MTLAASFLLDTDTVVELHRLGLWNSIVRHYGKVFLAETVYGEIRYYPSPRNPREPIKLKPLVKKGIVKKLKGEIITLKKIEEFLDKFDVTEKPELHPGELECLAIIVDTENLRFCTLEKAAIRALSMMGLEGRGISFEELISNCRIKAKLQSRYTRKYFDRWVVDGKFPLVNKPSDYFKKFMNEGNSTPF